MRTRLPEHICCDELVVCVSVSLFLSLSVCLSVHAFLSVCLCLSVLLWSVILLSALPSLSFSLCNHVSWLSSVLPSDQYFPYLIECQCATQNEDRTCERDFYFASHKLFVFYVFLCFCSCVCINIMHVSCANDVTAQIRMDIYPCVEQYFSEALFSITLNIFLCCMSLYRNAILYDIVIVSLAESLKKIFLRIQLSLATYIIMIIIAKKQAPCYLAK